MDPYDRLEAQITWLLDKVLTPLAFFLGVLLVAHQVASVIGGSP